MNKANQTNQSEPVAEPSAQETLLKKIPLELGGERLDRVIAELFDQYSRSRLQQWLKQGRVTINGKVVEKASQKVRGLDTLGLTPGVLEHMQDLTPEDIALEILGQTDEYTVVNKPAGLVVHPAPGHWSGTLMNGLYFLDPSLVHVPRAGIVHRLDADTTGLMVVARTSATQVKLVQMLQARIVKRVYLALAWGRVAQPVTVNQPLGRDPKNRLRMAVVDFGKPAVTHFTPVQYGEIDGVPVTLLVCRLETGRTHQIRVHAQFAGFALVADPVYKLRGAGNHSLMRQAALELPNGGQFARQALHAMHLSFPDPASFEMRQPGQDNADWQDSLEQSAWPEFIAPVPEDMASLSELAGIDCRGEVVHEAVMFQAALHRASQLVLVDEDLLEDEFEEVEVRDAD